MGAKVRIRDERKRLRDAVDRANITDLGRAGAYIRGMAKQSIKKSPKPAPPGHPPHTRKGQLKNAILFSVEKTAGTVVIGPTVTGVGRVGNVHEFGGQRRGKVGPGGYDPKPISPEGRAWRKGDWFVAVGGKGPIREGRLSEHGSVTGDHPTCRLRTQAQVDRAKRLAEGMGYKFRRERRVYPPRPFMGPALERSKARLPKFWANSVKGG